MLYTALQNLEDKQKIQLQQRKIQKPEMLKKQFKQQILSSSRVKTPHFDAFTHDFQIMMDALVDTRKTAFKNRLTEHAIPLTFESFLDLVDELRLKRHYLKSWKVDANKRFTEARVLQALGLLLPSKQHQHILGAANHAAKRLNIKFDERALRMVFSAQRKSRAEATLAYYGNRRKKSQLNPSERRNRENSMTAVQTKYNEFYPDGSWPRYNFHKFKICHYFYGKHNIEMIRRMLDTDQPHFQRDIEAAIETSTHVGRILNLAVFRLDQADKVLGKKDRRTRGAVQGRMREIRNAVAHNTPFYAIMAKEIPSNEGGEKVLLRPEDVFEAVFSAFYLPHVINKHGSASQNVNDLYSKLTGILKKQDYSWAFPNPQTSKNHMDHTPPHIIRHWSQKNRDEYANRNKWRLDKRHTIRKLCADWANSVRDARVTAKKGRTSQSLKLGSVLINSD